MTSTNPAAHHCGNCEGIDPDSCPFNPARVTSPAAELKAAAEKIRKLAGQATGAPWAATWREQEYQVDGYQDGDLHPVAEWTYAVATWEPQASEQRADCDTANADYIAAMHPGIGLLMAKWLEDTAATVEAVHRKRPDAVTEGGQWLAPALAVARAVLGEVSK
jgi:hypothetical protein